MSDDSATEEDPRPALFDGAVVAFNERDIAKLDEVVDDTIRTIVSSDLANSGEREGRQGFYEMMIGWTEPFSEMTMEAREYELLDESRMVVDIHQRAIGAGSGVPVELDVYFAVETVPRDGQLKMVHLGIHPDRTSALAALGLSD